MVFLINRINQLQFTQWRTSVERRRAPSTRRPLVKGAPLSQTADRFCEIHTVSRRPQTGCVDLTERVHLQRPPDVCMLIHARARTKTRGNPDPGTRVPSTKSCGLPRRNTDSRQYGSAGRKRNSKKCRRQSDLFSEQSRCVLAFRIGCLRLRRCRRTGVHRTCPGSRLTVWIAMLARACLCLDCHEFSSAPSHT